MEVLTVRAGDRVRWRSQAHGSWREKRGTVLAIVPVGARIEDVWEPPAGTPPTRLRWFMEPMDGRRVSARNWRSVRAVVEVPRPSGRGSDFYAPPVGWLEPDAGEARDDG